MRCGVRFDRSEEKLEELLAILSVGTSDSFFMRTRRPREEVSDWRALKASMSSREAGSESAS